VCYRRRFRLASRAITSATKTAMNLQELQEILRPINRVSPNELRWLDAALGVRAETRLPAHEQHRAFLLLMGHVRSKAEFAVAGRRGQSAKERESAMTKILGVNHGPYPFLVAAVERGAFR